MSSSNPLVDLFGQALEDQAGKPVQTSDALADVEAVGIYFSAHWCPPCRGFTPVLGKKYQELKDAGKKVEIVFASSDSDAAAFTEYADTMPWIRLPYADRTKKEELSQQYGVRGIPCLVFVDGQTGKLITDGGRSAVTSNNFIDDFPYHPKPVYDLGESTDGIDSSPTLVVMMEQADATVQQEMSELVLRLAIKEKADNQRVTKFFTGKGAGPTAQIRKGCGLAKLPPAKHEHEVKNIGEEGDGRWGCDGCGALGTPPRWTCPEGTCDFDYCQSCVDSVGSEVDAKIAAPTMAILNLQDQGAVYRPAAGQEEVTEANLEAFLEAFKNGSGLEKSQWVR